MMSPSLFDDARALVSDVISRQDAVSRIEPLTVRKDGAVLIVTTAAGVRLVLKLADGTTDRSVSFERVTTVTALARSTGTPVAEVVAADDSMLHSRWRYLITEHIDGVSWRQLRPLLTDTQVQAAHRMLAETLVGLQSLRFTTFGELDSRGQPVGEHDVVAALHRRADLRVQNPQDRAVFHAVLTRDSALFSSQHAATLCHDDLHHDNVLFRMSSHGPRLVALLDWDKAWAGPAESDVARMAFWDDMTGPGFWKVYTTPADIAGDAAHRALIYQLLWCLEYDVGTERHATDTVRLRQLLNLS